MSAVWEPGRYWRVTDEDGSVYSESSDEQEARADAAFPGRTLWRQWRRLDEEWRSE